MPLRVELAPIKLRLGAFLVDLIVLVGGGMLSLWTLMHFSNKSLQQLSPYRGGLLFFLFAVFVLYFSNTRTLGKRLAKITVIDISGHRPRSIDMVIRAVFYLSDIFLSLGSLALISIFRDSKQRRIGDFIAGTLVVKFPNIEAPDQLIYDEITSDIIFPRVIELPEELLLLVKEALISHDNHRNPAHSKILKLIADRIASQLNLNSTPVDSKLFLQTIVKDYITLTR